MPHDDPSDAAAAYFAADAKDRRLALAAATALATSRLPWLRSSTAWLADATSAYKWLRSRDSLIPVTVRIIPGTPYRTGAPPVTTVYNLADNDSVNFTLGFEDVKDAATAAPAGFSAVWSLADPDSTGAVLTPSADGTNADLSGGVPDSNLMVSVSVSWTNADGSAGSATGAEAVIVTASDPTQVAIVPGTVTPES